MTIETSLDRVEEFVRRSRIDKSLPWFGSKILQDMEDICHNLRLEIGSLKPEPEPAKLEFDL